MPLQARLHYAIVAGLEARRARRSVVPVLRFSAMLAAFSLMLLCSALPADARAAYVPGLHDGDTFPELALVDQRGRAVTFSDFRGSALVLSFFYARCPDRACSLISAKFANLAHGPTSEHMHLMEITLDPEHDTARVLANYGATFGADSRRWTLATGDRAAIDGIMARANVVAEQTPAGIAHSSAILILDGQGRLFGTLEGDATPAEVRAEVRAALGKTANAGTPILRWLGESFANVCGGRSGVPATTALWLFAALLTAGALSGWKLFATGAARR